VASIEVGNVLAGFKKALPGQFRGALRETLIRATSPLRLRGPLPARALDEAALLALPDVHEGVELTKTRHRFEWDDPTLAVSPLQRRPRSVDIDRSLVRVRSTEGWRFDHGHLVTPANEIVYESNLALADLACAFRPLHRSIHRVDGVVAYLSNTWPTNFYHWLILTLPLVDRYHSLGEPDWYYVGEPLTSWQVESLRLVGITEEQVITEPVTGDELWTSIATRHGGGLDPESLGFLRARTHIGGSPTGSRRFFVARGQTTTRRFLNERQAFAVASEFGFEWIVTSEMSLTDEIELFAQAEAVVGCHGAALTNICFAPTDVTVLELFPHGLSDSSIHIFQELVAAVGGTYAAMEGTALRGPDRKQVDQDLIIDLDQLRDVMTRQFGRPD
jgi:hypothetical protein